jgi:hypothetical protein
MAGGRLKHQQGLATFDGGNNVMVLGRAKRRL